MTYTIDFSVISAAYLTLAAITYLRQRKVPSLRAKLFLLLLICGAVSSVLDIVAAVEDPYAYMLPSWLVYAVNIVFLASVQLSCLIFFFYTTVLTGVLPRMRGFAHAAFTLPFAVVFVLLLLSPFSGRFIFILDENNVYSHGACHISLYISSAYYMLSSVAMVLSHRAKLQRNKVVAIMLFIIVVVCAMLVQLKNPYLLLNSAGNAFALLLIYQLIESPSLQLDALTGAFNRSALPPLISDAYAQEQSFALLIWGVLDIDLINSSVGMKGGDSILISCADYLRRAYPRSYVFRAAGDVFAVLFPTERYIDKAELEKLRAAVPENMSTGAAELRVELSLAGINSQDCANTTEMLSMFEALLALHWQNELDVLLLADGRFKTAHLKRTAMAQAMERILKNESIQVYYQPLHRADGSLGALEALIRFFDDRLGMLPTQDMVVLAEQNGSINRLGSLVYRKTCEFIRDNDLEAWGLDHVGVNLSAIQCMRAELADELMEITAEYGVKPSLVAFEITETAVSSTETTRVIMDRLTARGFHFLLDDFGTGYANFNNMVLLPYHCVKIDKCILWNAVKSKPDMAFLANTVQTLKALELSSVCEGVETEEQARLLCELGITLMQGYYFSKPLPPEKMTEYYYKLRQNV